MSNVRGYTLVELLVVISIIAILSFAGFVSFKDFSEDQVAKKAQGQIHSLLRLAQSNATSSTKCPKSGVADQGAKVWSLVVIDAETLNLNCDIDTNPATADHTYRSYSLENAEISIKGSDCVSDAGWPFAMDYLSGNGALTFSSAGASDACLASAAWTFTLTNKQDTRKTTSFRLSKGGAIDVQ